MWFDNNIWKINTPRGLTSLTEEQRYVTINASFTNDQWSINNVAR